MAGGQPYLWDFDRDANLSNGPVEYMTFSVGVFQWLPKASGKGLKKSKTVRVCGYVAEPQRVYDFAESLCRRLNKARASAEDPPDWLQKQYSVPKPDGLVIERTSDDLTGAQVRAVRQQVMRERLFSVGFTKAGGGMYVRQVGDQLHLIDFQANKYGHSFTVNLGFHYTFIPPLFQERRLGLAELEVLDFAFGARIGHFLPENRDTWFEYGRDRDALAAVFERCAEVSLSVLEQRAIRWHNPADALAEVASGPGWPWDCRDDDFAGGCIAMRLGKWDEAESLLKKWIAESQVYADRPVYEELTGRLNLLRRGECRDLIDWITQ